MWNIHAHSTQSVMLRLQTVGSIHVVLDKRVPIRSRISFILRLGPPSHSFLLIELSCCTNYPYSNYLTYLPPPTHTTAILLQDSILNSMGVLDRILMPSGFIGTVVVYLTNLTILLVLGLLGYYSASTYTTYRRLRHIPGPRVAAFSKWWMLRNTLGGSMHLALKEACETYGKRG